jgi:hypothetical protein
VGSTGRVAGVVALVAMLGAGAAVTPSDGDTPGLAAGPANGVGALAALDELPVRNPQGRAGAVRARTGTAWLDTDRNGCLARDDVLRRDLREIVVADDGCTVVAGTLTDPYTGAVVRYPRVTLRVDRVVALDDAWVTGGAQLPAGRRAALANDPLNLLATTAAAADRKAGAGAAGWLPRRTFRCPYVARQIAVKRAYGLWVTPAERTAMAQVLAGCPGQLLPTARATSPLVRRSPLPPDTEPPDTEPPDTEPSDTVVAGSGTSRTAPLDPEPTPVPSPSQVAPDGPARR